MPTSRAAHEAFTALGLALVIVRTRVPPRHRRHPGSVFVAIAGSALLLLSACAEFDDTASAEWSKAPELTPQQGPEPTLPESSNGGESGRPEPSRPGEPSSIPPPDGCTDFDPAVIATCLDSIDAVAAFTGGAAPSALAGERKSGKVFRVEQGGEPSTWATLDVDPSGDGGLTGLALSPTYSEDRLVFAYVTTAKDNRVLRFAKGQQPKAVLTGIPKGGDRNRGAIIDDGTGALLVATGDAGDTKAASDPDSLAGKVLRIDTSGQAAEGNPEPGSRVIASGLRSPGGLCTSADGSRIWVTDRTARADAVYRVDAGAALDRPVWTWKDRPGVAGCGDSGSGITVAMSTKGSLHHVRIDPDGAVTGKPEVTFDDEERYGRLSGMDVLGEGVAVVGTVNKSGGKTVSSDDRVVLLPLEPVGGTGGQD